MFRFNGEEYPTRLIALDMPEISGQQLISVEEARAIDEEVSLHEGNSLPLLASLLQQRCCPHLFAGVQSDHDSA